MRAVDIIRRKRDGAALSRVEIEAVVAGATSGKWPEYQVSAWLMAVFFRGLSDDETTWLTEAMIRSGDQLDLSDIPGPKVDKHSTGGVGDKTSLILAPLAAACGVIVPMMSGRGLGHSGGTLDKLEAIPGFRVGLSLPEFRQALRAVGCGLIGQTAEIAPADKILYALRDVTATVESIPLITASIMSKKIAEGIEALVLDVKCGRGAFMKNRGDAYRLAESLVAVGRANRLRTRALLTAMDAPLGLAVGNALEVIECIETLKGRGPRDLERLSVALAAHMLALTGPTFEEAETRIRAALASGAGLEKFRDIVAHQGGDPRILDDYALLPTAPERLPHRIDRSGFVVGLDAEKIGRATMLLGAGREKVSDAIDAAVGVRLLAKPGDPVRPGDALAEIHYRDGSRLSAARSLLADAFDIGDEPPTAPQLILDVIG